MPRKPAEKPTSIMVGSTTQGPSQPPFNESVETVPRSGFETDKGASTNTHLRILAEFSQDLILLMTQEGKQLYANPAIASVLGYQQDERIGSNGFELVHPEDLPRVAAAFSEGLADGKPRTVIYRARHKSGNWITLETMGISTEVDGELCVVLNSRDITERLKAEADARRLEKSFAKIFNASPNPMTISEVEDSTYVAANDAWLKFHGYRRNEVVGKKALDLGIWKSRGDRKAYIKSLMDGESQENNEVIIRTKSGAEHFMLVSGELIDFEGKKRLLTVAVDITERKLMEAELADARDRLEERVVQRTEELAASEKRFRDFAEVGSDWIWETDANHCYTFISNQITGIAEVIPEEAYGKSRFDYRPPEEENTEPEKWQNHRDDLTARRPFRDFQYPFITKSGRKIFIRVSGNPVFDDKGVFLGYRGTGTDVTKEVMAERAITLSEDRFRDFTDVSTDWVWEMGPDLRFTYFSKRLSSILGIPVDREIGKTRRQLSGREMSDENWEAHRQDLEARREFKNFQYVYRHPAGHPLYLRISGKPIFDHNGDFLGYRGVGADVTKEVEAKEALKRSEARFRDFAEVGSDWFWETDAEGKYTYISEQIYDVVGIRPEDIVGKTRQDLRTNEDYLDDPERWESHFLEMEEQREVREFRYRYRRADGKTFHIQVSGKPIYDEQGVFIGYRGSGSDVTKTVEAAQALNAAKAEAERASTAKSDFLAKMSHELRTPLNAIIGFSDAMRHEVFGPVGNEKYVAYPEHIFTSGKHLLDLIDDILDLSKIEAGKMELSPESIDLKPMLEALCTTIKPLADWHKNKLSLSYTDDIGNIFADRKRLNQILLNLLSNACKFTRTGTVTLSVKVEERSGRSLLAFAVIDNGVGIQEDEIGKLFGEFVQIDSTASHASEGTGLGLAISRRLAELMGGDIGVESVAGEGSTFTLRIPLASLHPLAERTEPT